MRFGGPVFGNWTDPQDWVNAVRQKGYRAAYCPVAGSADGATVRAFAEAAKAADIVIAEVGAWSNTISTDTATRQKAIAHCQAQLSLAERLGAVCCVNIAGSRGSQWDGPHPDNLSADTFDLIVQTVREILDAVKPLRTSYTLEPMPWVFPDSPESYLRLIQAIDRQAFGVHLDPVNMINSPERFFNNGAFLRHCFALLGPHIRSCHAKDIDLSGKLTVHLDETCPGDGKLDYAVFLQEMNRLGADIPLLTEHLPTEEEYDRAAAYIRTVAEQQGILL